jgi:hypothetical protein
MQGLAKVVNWNAVAPTLQLQISSDLANLLITEPKGHRCDSTIELSLWQLTVAHMVKAGKNLQPVLATHGKRSANTSKQRLSPELNLVKLFTHSGSWDTGRRRPPTLRMLLCGATPDRAGCGKVWPNVWRRWSSFRHPHGTAHIDSWLLLSIDRCTQ